MADTVKSEYGRRASQHAASRDAERRLSGAISRWRLATFLPGFALLVWALTGAGALVFAAAAALLLAFAVLVGWHARVDERAEHYEALRLVNARASARLDRSWDDLPAGHPPPGAVTADHPYADDLDVFGRASLFQWIGSAATPRGASILAAWLLAPADRHEVAQRQDAVDDLAPRIDWRELLAAFGARASAQPDPDTFLRWVEETGPPLPRFGFVRMLVYVLTASIWVLAGLHALGLAPALWTIPLLIGMILSFATAGRVQHAFDAAGSSEVALRRYAPLFAHLAEERFTATRLVALQQRLRSDTEDADRAMARLNRILGFSELRRGAAIFHFVVQAFTLWDFYVLFALLRWRRVARRHVRDWIGAAGEIDALACCAAIRHDNPEWCRPELVDEKVFAALALGHPLLPEDRRVPNDVTVGPSGSVLLITGSNMSGKSTLLRAIGLNAVLAQAGAPCCARTLRMPSADLRTSIRIQDSLEHGVSYFMAALARLKAVVDAAERRESDRVLLYLLDEILQGTNSAERGIAVQAVARHLLDAGAIGAMTTHDLTIAEEEPLRSSAVLVHFTETVGDDGGMSFDYKLRPGIATSRNALRLMRLIGIR